MTDNNISNTKVAIYVAIITVLGSIIGVAISNVDKLKSLSPEANQNNTVSIRRDTVNKTASNANYGINEPKIEILERAVELIKERTEQGQEVVCVYSDLIVGIGEVYTKRFIRNLNRDQNNLYVYKICVLTDKRVNFFNLQLKHVVSDTLEDLGTWTNTEPFRLDFEYIPEKVEDFFFYLTAKDYNPDIPGGHFCVIISHQM